MAYYVKVIPPGKRARVHIGECRHCRNGQGQEGQDKGGSRPTYWSGPYADLASANAFMAGLGPGYDDTGHCRYCKPGVEL